MRRFFLVLLGITLVNTAMFAQLSSSVQIGKATRELRDSGLSAAHFNIPLGARVKISNVMTGKEIEVTIRGRIALSPNRIVDLSPAAWDALGLSPDSEVRLVPPPSLSSGTTRAPAPPASNVPDDAIAEEDELEELEAIAEWGGEEEAELAELTDADDAFFDDEEPAVQTRVQPRQSTPSSQPIKVIPGLPNPNSRKFYRLQVGAFSLLENVEEYEQRAQALGFVTVREKHGSLTRVVLEGVRAPDVQLATEELEEAGFTEVWVREY